MNKLSLIIQREYITRVRNKSFLLTTFLAPLGFLVFFLAVGLIFSNKTDKVYKVAIKNESGVDIKIPESTERVAFSYSNDALDLLKSKYLKKEIDGKQSSSIIISFS